MKSTNKKKSFGEILSKFLYIIFVLSIGIGFFYFKKDIKINRLDVNAIVLENGDVDVTESFVYQFKGSYNGVFREYKISGCDDYVIKSITVEDESGNEIKAMYSESGAPNTFDIEYNLSSTNVKLYSPSKNEIKKVTIDYTIKNAATRYNDCSVLYWNFYDVPEKSVVKEGTLRVALNNAKFEEDSFYYKVYGDGEINNFANEEHISIGFKKLSSMIGVKVKFQEEFLDESIESKGYNYKEPVYNKESEGIDFITCVMVVVVFVVIAVISHGLQAAFIASYNHKLTKYRSKANPDNRHTNRKGNGMAPYDLEPAFVSLIYNDGKTYKNVILDSILYLINNGYYRIVENGPLNLNKNLVIVKTGKDINNEKPHLVYLFKWFNSYAEKDAIDINYIHKYLENRTYAGKYIRHKREFEDLIKKDAIKEGIAVKIQGNLIISNEYMYDKADWKAYRSVILSNIHEIRHLPKKDIDDIFMYSLSLGVQNNQYDSIINSVRTIVTKAEGFESFVSELSRELIIMQSINNLLDVTEKAILDYNAHNDSYSDSGSIGGGGSFSGGGGGSSGGF